MKWVINMKISFFDDEPEIFPLQYGGKARTILNLATEFAKRKEVEQVTILSRSIIHSKKQFKKNGIRFISLDDSNTMRWIKKACDESDVINIHCCSFTFPFIKSKAKKFYFLHDVLIATAEKGSHLDKALGGSFDYVIAPSDYARDIYEKNRKLLGGGTKCVVIPRHINQNLFENISKEDLLKRTDTPLSLKIILKKYKYILFFPSRPIEEKGGKYMIELAERMKNKGVCVMGPFDNSKNMPNNCINTHWIESEKLKYYYSAANVTCNFSLLPESFSQVCIESINCGTPVVSFGSGNIKNLSKKIKAIIICKKELDDIEKKVLKAIRLKENKKGIEKEIKRVREDYKVDTIVDKYIRLYKEK